MSKILILNNYGSEKYSIISLKNIEHFEEHMGEPDVSQEINDWNASNQNVGVCIVYANQEIKNIKSRQVFIEICDMSVGKFKLTTDRVSRKEIAKKLGISERTFGKYIKELEQNGFLKINKSEHKAIGTGSLSNSYTPIFKQ